MSESTTKALISTLVQHMCTPVPTEGRGSIDLRPLYLQPVHLTYLTDALYEKIKHLDNIQIGGVESAALPLVTSLVLKASKLGKKVNGFYIRKSRKKHGNYLLIEGAINQNPVVMVDDLINSGHSLLWSQTVLQDHNLTVIAIVTIVQFYDNAHYAFLTKSGATISALYTLESLGHPLQSKQHILYNPYPIALVNRPPRAAYSIVGPKSFPAVTDSTVCYGSDMGVFACFERVSGKKTWEIKTGLHAESKNIFSAPTIHNDYIFFGSYDGKFYALEHKTGIIRWVFDDCDWIGSSPAISPAHALVFIGLEHSGPEGQRGSIVALEAHTGKRVWEFKMKALTHASPLYIEKFNQVAIGSNEGVLYLLDAETGALQWKFETEGGQRFIGVGGFSPGDIKHRPAYDEESDLIATCSIDGYMYVLNRADGRLRYRNVGVASSEGKYIGSYGSPLFTKQYVLYASADKYMYCLDKHTGSIVWKFYARSRMFSSPVVREDHVFIGTNMGRLYELLLTDGTFISVTQFPERVSNPVVISEDTMYVTTNDNALYALTLKE